MALGVGEIWRTRSGFDFEFTARSAFTPHLFAVFIEDERILWTVNADGTIPDARSNEHQFIKRIA